LKKPVSQSTFARPCGKTKKRHGDHLDRKLFRLLRTPRVVALNGANALASNRPERARSPLCPQRRDISRFAKKS
jgi:hypothetical protein